MTEHPATLAAEIDRLVELARALNVGINAVTQTERPEGAELDHEVADTLSDAQLDLERMAGHLLDAQALAAALS